MKIWRLVKTRYASAGFDGEGARLYGGRWNSPGTRVAYASSNSALAVLEVLVHLGTVEPLGSWSFVTGTLPDDLIENFDASRLPPDWNSFPVSPGSQAVGDQWIAAGSSLALRVPSALVTDSDNILINPAHLDFARLEQVSIEPFAFDPRLAVR